MRVLRLGVFGGSFDPPHLGHLIAASQAAERERLDRVLFVPAGRSPFKDKEPAASAADRLAMLRLAVGDDARFAVDEREVKRPPPSYTIDTLRDLRKEHGADVELVLLLGIDALAGFPGWREVSEIVRMAEIGVVARPGAKFPAAALKKTLGAAGVKRLQAAAEAVIRVDVSSTDIRSRIRGGRTIRYLVTREVEQYIVERGLYRPIRQVIAGKGKGKGKG